MSGVSGWRQPRLFAKDGQSDPSPTKNAVGGFVMKTIHNPVVVVLRICVVASIILVLHGGAVRNSRVSAQEMTLDASYVPLYDGGWNSYDDGSMIKVLASNGSYMMHLFNGNGELYEKKWIASDSSGLNETKAQIWVDPNDYRRNTQYGAPREAGYVEEFHLWNPSFTILPWGLKVGESRVIAADEEISIPNGSDGAVGQCATQNWTSWKYVRVETTVTLETAETITVPAGTFDTLKITLVQRERNSPYNSPCGLFSPGETINLWLAQGVGIVQQLARGSVTRLVRYAQDPTMSYLLLDRGGFTRTSQGGSDEPIIGYARIQPTAGKTAPAGVAIFGLRQNGVLVTEAGVPASPLVREGRIYAQMDSDVSTGIAIANPGEQPAEINYYFTNSQGVDSGGGKTSIEPKSQISVFLDQAPFNGSSEFRGSFSFSSAVPVSVIAIRGLYNERHEFLITTLPVADMSKISTEPLVLAHFAYGEGWTTQVVLVNPTNGALNGTVEFWGQGHPALPGVPASVIINGELGSSFPYNIPSRSSVVLQTSGNPQGLQSGSVRVLPVQGQESPSGLCIFSFRNREGITVSEAGVPNSSPVGALRMYVAALGNFGDYGSAWSGVAIANPSSSETMVLFETTNLDGSSGGYTGSMPIPGLGQISLFLNQIPGFEAISKSFQGILRISTESAAGIAVVGLRGRYNERGDFLVTTIPSANENGPPNSDEVLFPHLVDGGGYQTQIVLVHPFPIQTSAGIIRFFRNTGQGWIIPFN